MRNVWQWNDLSVYSDDSIDDQQQRWEDWPAEWDEKRLMCRAEVGCAAEPYDCLQKESCTWELDSSNPS